MSCAATHYLSHTFNFNQVYEKNSNHTYHGGHDAVLTVIDAIGTDYVYGDQL